MVSEKLGAAFVEVGADLGPLEKSLGSIPGMMHNAGTNSFNPCFSGTRARTSAISRSSPSILCFNPCFSGTRARTF